MTTAGPILPAREKMIQRILGVPAVPKSVHISTPWPTREEMTRDLRISKARRRELEALAEEGARQILKAEKESGAKAAVKRKAKPRNASAAA